MNTEKLENIINRAFEDMQNVSDKSETEILNAVSYTHLTLPTIPGV